MKLFFPQWQGSGNGTSIQNGALVIRDHFGKHLFQEISLSNLPAGGDGQQRFKINNYDAITRQLSRFKTFLEEQQPETLIVLGGDCGLEIVPVSYLNDKYPHFGVVWFDAHADINTPFDSPSNNFHGMPLRTLLGEGTPEMDSLLFSKLQDHQLHYVGLRDVDVAEQERIRLGNIYHSKEVDAPALIQTLQAKGIQQLYLHFDVDCLDPGEYGKTYYQVPDGIPIAAAQHCIAALKENFEVVGPSILESVALNTAELKSIVNILEALLE